MPTTRTYASRRMHILDALVIALKQIDGSGTFLSNVYENVHPRLKFWDEVEEFPAIHLNAGGESRQYQTAGYKDRFLTVTLRCYVNEEDAQSALSALLEDVETVLEKHSKLVYYDSTYLQNTAQQITIISIDTDEGALEPLGVGEIVIEVRY
jgi:hypothetical protein